MSNLGLPEDILAVTASFAEQFNDKCAQANYIESEVCKILIDLSKRLCYDLDKLFPRRKNPSFENLMWAAGLILAAWNGYLRKLKAIDRSNISEERILDDIVIPSFSAAVKEGKSYAEEKRAL